MHHASDRPAALCTKRFTFKVKDLWTSAAQAPAADIPSRQPVFSRITCVIATNEWTQDNPSVRDTIRPNGERLCPARLLANRLRAPHGQSTERPNGSIAAIRCSLDPFNDLLTEQALRAEHQKHEGKNIGEPVFGCASDHRPDRKLEKLLPHTNDQTADNSTGD